MSSIKFVLLSLLAREPLSGYDIKQQMKDRINFFYKINNNQLYPLLSKLETEGLVQLQSHERESYRPARKVYKITDQGIKHLKEWVMEPSEPGNWDEFLLKQYNSWLIAPEVLIPHLKKKKAEHEQRVELYTGKIASIREQNQELTSDHPLFSSIAIIEMGISFEKSCSEWCDKMIGWLKSNQIG
ncbi:hypothetical protein HMSSN036_48680 [Paenibacillus macerans]|nr:hypothetical protein HMSSN036_48680 [Paenibacillus macerans]